MFLQIATEFASLRNVSSPSQPIRLAAEDKLDALRRIDKSRPWNCLDDRLYCTICKHEISGRQIEVVGGTNGLHALRLKCSTPGCLSTPADWILPVKSESSPRQNQNAGVGDLDDRTARDSRVAKVTTTLPFGYGTKHRLLGSSLQRSEHAWITAGKGQQ